MVDLDRYGYLGVQRLKEATPVDTGETRDRWHYKIVKNKIFFYNDNANIVRFLCYGHVTTAGTWVAGSDFVSPILKEIQNDIRRETLIHDRRILRRERRRKRVDVRFK